MQLITISSSLSSHLTSPSTVCMLFDWLFKCKVKYNLIFSLLLSLDLHDTNDVYYEIDKFFPPPVVKIISVFVNLALVFFLPSFSLSVFLTKRTEKIIDLQATRCQKVKCRRFHTQTHTHRCTLSPLFYPLFSLECSACVTKIFLSFLMFFQFTFSPSWGMC